MNDTRTRELYSSPNGDRWHLCKDASGRVFVLHQANIPSGGQTSHIELGDFLTRGYGLEQQALSQMIGTLIESTPGELLTGECDPGLAVSGGSSHTSRRPWAGPTAISTRSARAAPAGVRPIPMRTGPATSSMPARRGSTTSSKT